MTKYTTSRLYRNTAFDYVNIALLTVITLITVYPVWSVFIITLNDPTDTLAGKLWLLPRVWTLYNYTSMFTSETKMAHAVLISVARTVIGSLSSVIFTASAAYSISKKYLRGQKFYIGAILFPMYIGGGLIPYFLLIKNIGLYQNFLVYIIPALLSPYFCIIMYSFFRTVPQELEESVKMDGGNDLIIFFKIIIPVSIPVMAAVCLFFGVSQWNAWFDTMLFGGEKLMTLQVKLVNMLRNVAAALELAKRLTTVSDYVTYKPTVQSMQATCMMITAIPVIIVYPFMQKYFIKGLMIGSLKG